MCVGLAQKDQIFYARAAGPGNPVVYVGSKTGRDGIHGATMASAEFSEEAEARRPTVQVGDPFTEKLLLEACLELMQTDAIVAIQDMGAAGLTSSSFEMAARGGVGIELDLDRVPTREAGMSAYEIMLSESQERMLLVLRQGAEDSARAIFDKWGLDCATVGRVIEVGAMVLRFADREVARVPIAAVSEASPIYQRPWLATAPGVPIAARDVPPPLDPPSALKRLLGSPDLCAKRWIVEQYDQTVMGDTVQGPGGDAAVIRIHGTDRAIALTTDCTPRYCVADPRRGGTQAVAEAWRNLCAVGARPLAVTDCLNFGNPENPIVMGQFVGCIEGMREACQALDFPVVSGNVSFYNDPDDRRPRRDRRSRSDGEPGLPGEGSGPDPDRRELRLARQLALSARDLRARGRPAAAGRSRARAPERRVRARADRPGLGGRLPRPRRWRPLCGTGRDGAGLRDRGRPRAAGGFRSDGLAVRRRAGAVSAGRLAEGSRPRVGPGARAGRSGPPGRGHGRGRVDPWRPECHIVERARRGPRRLAARVHGGEPRRPRRRPGWR
jgi:hydrogenase maturation factor